MLLKPDVLFSWPWKAELLRRIDFPGLSEINPFSAYGADHGALDILRQFGRISGRVDRARELADGFNERFEAIRRLIRSAAAPSVAILFDRSSRSQAGNGYPFVISYLSPLGARIAATSNAYTPTSLERLLLLDPDVILIDSGSDDDTPAEIYNRPGWRRLHAVGERRIYRIPNHFDHNLVVEGPFLLQWAAEILYPLQMPRQLRLVFKDSFNYSYSYDFGEGGIDRAIFLDENIISAGYDRFLK